MKKTLLIFFFPLFVFTQNNFSMYFDQVSSYVNFGVIENFISSGQQDSFTISFWLKNETEQGDYQDVAQLFGSGLDQPPAVYINSTTGVFLPSIGNINGALSGEPLFPELNEWSYLTIRQTSSGFPDYNSIVDVFYNGVFSFSSSDYVPNGWLTCCANEFVIGAYFDYITSDLIRPFKGKMDDFTIWNYSLSETEINTIMNCNPTGSEEGLVAYWNFEEGVGSTEVLDQTSNNHNGVFYSIIDASFPNSTATYNSDVRVTPDFISCSQSESSTPIDEDITTDPIYLDCSILEIDGLEEEFINFGSFNGFADSNNFTIQMNLYIDQPSTEFINLLNNQNSFNDPNGFNIFVGDDPAGSYCPSGYNLFSFRMNGDNGPGAASGCGGNSLGISGSDYCISDSDFYFDSWLNIAITVNENGNVKFYFNGNLVYNQNCNLPVTFNSTADLVFGQAIGGGIDNFIGKIDNIHIWSKELSESEINSYLNCTPYSASENLEGLWKFDNLSDLILDSSGNGQDGFLFSQETQQIMQDLVYTSYSNLICCTYDNLDFDGDGITNAEDDDIDGDGILNINDDDIDGDGILNINDDDIDGDGVIDDIDGDGILNVDDEDIDGDGIIDSDDDDIDGDGALNIEDDDMDGDGILNVNDNDIDGDGMLNIEDDDMDADGMPNLEDDDIDGDFIYNIDDNDMDGDGIVNSDDSDMDADGIQDNEDDFFPIDTFIQDCSNQITPGDTDGEINLEDLFWILQNWLQAWPLEND